MNKGKIIQVMGPVVDVVFQDGNLPFIKDALEVENNGKKCVMEVAQHLGNNLSIHGISLLLRMRLKLIIMERSALWRLRSTWETTRCAA